MGFLLFYLSGYSQKQSKSDSLIQVLDSNKNLEDTTKLRVLNSIFADNSVKPVLRLKYIKQAYEIANRLDKPIWLYSCALNEGYVYKKQGNLEQALKSLIESANYANQLDDKLREAISYGAIAGVYKVENNYKTALNYYNKCISAFREIGDSTRLGSYLMNTGELYRTNHILDTALLYFNESGRIFFKLNYKVGSAYNLGNIGLVYAERGEHELAEKNLLEATKILNELGDKYPVAVYNTYMADIYMSRNDFNRALAYAKNSYDVSMEQGLKEQIRDASLKLSELYEIDKDYENAFKYQKKYIAFRDSINNEETIRKMADLRTEFEVAQKQAEVDLLNQEQNTYFIIGLSLLALIILTGALAWIFHKRNLEKLESNKLLTEKKAQLEYQRAELQRLNNTKDRFFSIISHDLRGPVNAFRGLTSIIKYSVDEKEYDKLPEIVERINNSSAQLSLLLDNLLDWAVNQQEQFPFDPEKIVVSEFFNKMTGIFQNMADSKGIELKTNFESELAVWADRNSLRAILRNLVNNAIKFTEKGGSVTLSAVSNNGFIELSVIDTGIGISNDKLESLNKMKEEKSTVGTDGEKGLGLGLRLVYEFSEMNKGQVKVESSEGKGTTFSILLPKFDA